MTTTTTRLAFDVDEFYPWYRLSETNNHPEIEVIVDHDTAQRWRDGLNAAEHLQNEILTVVTEQEERWKAEKLAAKIRTDLKRSKELVANMEKALHETEAIINGIHTAP